MPVDFGALIIEAAFGIGEKLLYDLIKEGVKKISRKSLDQRIRDETKRISSEQKIDLLQLEQMTEIVIEQSVMRTPGITSNKKFGKEYIEFDTQTTEKSQQLMFDLKSTINKLQSQYNTNPREFDSTSIPNDDDIIIEEVSKEGSPTLNTTYGHKVISELKRRIAEIESENVRK